MLKKLLNIFCLLFANLFILNSVNAIVCYDHTCDTIDPRFPEYYQCRNGDRVVPRQGCNYCMKAIQDTTTNGAPDIDTDWTDTRGKLVTKRCLFSLPYGSRVNSCVFMAKNNFQDSGVVCICNDQNYCNHAGRLSYSILLASVLTITIAIRNNVL